MKQAFVLQLGSETETARRHFAGCIEEVDTGTSCGSTRLTNCLNFSACALTRLSEVKKNLKDL